MLSVLLNPGIIPASLYAGQPKVQKEERDDEVVVVPKRPYRKRRTVEHYVAWVPAKMKALGMEVFTHHDVAKLTDQHPHAANAFMHRMCREGVAEEAGLQRTGGMPRVLYRWR